LALSKSDHNSGKEILGVSYYSKAAAFSEWISGYITAQNGAYPLSKQFSVDMAGVSLWIKNYCEKNPTTIIWTAVNELLRAHGVLPMVYVLPRN